MKGSRSRRPSLLDVFGSIYRLIEAIGVDRLQNRHLEVALVMKLRKCGFLVMLARGRY